MTTPWQAGSFDSESPRLLFGRMHEDAAIELEAFATRSRVFCIASAGCMARTLAAAGHFVTAVDINPYQVEYAQSRMNGGAVREGAAEQMISRGRAMLGLIGWTQRKRRDFLHLEDPAQQTEYWDQKLDSSLWRAAIDTVLSPGFLRLIYGSRFVNFVGRGFGAMIRRRLRRCWANHPNRFNPFAWNMILGAQLEDPGPAVNPIRLACSDAASFLENCPPKSFDAFSLSNIYDGASEEYVERLQTAVRRAATPGAVVITRSFAEPAFTTDSNWASRDRSFLWGRVSVMRLGGN